MSQSHYVDRLQRTARRFGFGLCALAGLVLGGCGNNSFLVPPPLVADPLATDARWNPRTPTAEQTADIEVVIQNQGGLPAKSFLTRVFVIRNPCGQTGDTIFDTLEQIVGNYEMELEDGLLSGEAQLRVATHDFNNRSGIYGLYINVDDLNDIDETIPGSYNGEANNNYDCNEIVAANGDVLLSQGETFISVNSPGGDDGDGDGFIGIIIDD